MLHAIAVLVVNHLDEVFLGTRKGRVTIVPIGYLLNIVRREEGAIRVGMERLQGVGCTIII